MLFDCFLDQHGTPICFLENFLIGLQARFHTVVCDTINSMIAHRFVGGGSNRDLVILLQALV